MWRIYFDRRRDFNVRLVSIVYYVAHLFYNSAQLCRLYFAAYICLIHLPHTFAAYIFRLHLPHTFSAYICRIHLPHTFAAYIFRLHFEQVSSFYTCANILGKCQYFNDFCNKFLLDFVAANICVYFLYLFMQFCVHQYFWRNCFEA